ncbi:hypothetical protein OQA88_3100 [Cercophora sp. LCS_1]
MRHLLTLVFFFFLATWASAQIVVNPPVIDNWTWWSLKADIVFDAKVASMPAGTIGAPKAFKKREGTGYKREYELATLYTEGGSDNAYAVNGDILARYVAVGGAAGVLGHPTSDWTPTDDNRGGWYNTFRNGAIYWTWSLGAREVHTQIYTRWLQLGAHRSWLGYPVTGVQPGGAGSNAERISAFEKGFITYNTNGNVATAIFGYRDLIVAKYNAIGGAKSKVGLPLDRTMPFYLDGLGSARIAFRGGSVWVPLDSTRALAQWHTQIKVRFLGMEHESPPTSGEAVVSGALAVFVPSTRAIGTIFKMSDWRFSSPSLAVKPVIWPHFGGNPDNLLYDGPPAELIFLMQHVGVRTSNAAGVSNWIAAALGLDIIGRIAEADGTGNPPIDVDKALAGEAYTWPFRIGATTQNMYSQTDTVFAPGVLRLNVDLVHQHSQQRGQCITNMASTDCPWHLRVSDTVRVLGPGGAFVAYRYHFVIERYQVNIDL